jgi:hypothetical protein
MQLLNARYCLRYNRRHVRVGTLLRRRYFSRLVMDDQHLLQVWRYIALNPVEAGFCPRPEDWPWSSHRALLGLPDPENIPAAGRVLRYFNDDRGRARERYGEFVEDGLALLRARRASDMSLPQR